MGGLGGGDRAGGNPLGQPGGDFTPTPALSHHGGEGSRSGKCDSSSGSHTTGVSVQEMVGEGVDSYHWRVLRPAIGPGAPVRQVAA